MEKYSTRKLITLASASLVIILAFFALKSYVSKQETSKNLVQIETVGERGTNLEKNYLTPVEKYTQNSNNTPLPDNLTQALAKSISDGSSFSNPSFNLNNWIGSQLEGVEKELLKQIVEEKRLVLVNTPSEEDYSNYYKLINALLANYLNSTLPVFVKTPESLTKEDFTFFKNKLGETVEGMYGAKIPNNLTEFHKEQIRLLLIQKVSFEKLENYQEDPLAALAAALAIQSSAEEINNLVQLLNNQNDGN